MQEATGADPSSQRRPAMSGCRIGHCHILGGRRFASVFVGMKSFRALWTTVGLWDDWYRWLTVVMGEIGVAWVKPNLTSQGGLRSAQCSW